MKRARWWTDEEIGFLLDNPDMSARELGEILGRGRQSVQKKRLALERGEVPQVEAWTQDEDDFILANPHLDERQVAAHLGRTVHAVRGRRSIVGRREGVNFYGSKDPGHVGKRPLLAKTCPKCGLFLGARWFGRTTDDFWKHQCIRCRPPQDRTGYKPPTKSDFYDRVQQVTREKATNNGHPWTEKDHEVLSDPDLPIVTKAIRLGRTYAAVAKQCHDHNYRSLVGLGPAEHAAWVIHFTKETAA